MNALCPTCNKFMDYTTNSYVCTGCGKVWGIADLLEQCRETLHINAILDKNVGQLRRENAELTNSIQLCHEHIRILTKEKSELQAEVDDLSYV